MKFPCALSLYERVPCGEGVSIDVLRMARGEEVWRGSEGVDETDKCARVWLTLGRHDKTICQGAHSEELLYISQTAFYGS